jgi:glycerate 2-kinase
MTDRLLIAPDKFKGTFSAAQVATAVGRGVERAGFAPPDLCPVADGGDGTMAVLLTALGGETAGTTATDPLGRAISAGFALIEDGATAIVEVAEASGLARLGDDERDPERASSRGTGELIAAAVDTGATVVLVAAGGSATTDGGAGAIEAVRDAGGLRGAKLVVLCDVRTPFEDAARVYGPQKGAGPDAVARLTERLASLAGSFARDPRGVPMTGAAGGLAGGLWSELGARLEPGGPFVLEALGFDERMRATKAVVTGEGRLDATTLEGKVAGEIATRARQGGVPCHAVCGQNAMSGFDARILDLQRIVEAPALSDLEDAGAFLAANL